MREYTGPPKQASVRSGRAGAALVIAAATLLFARLAVYRLRSFSYPLDLGAALAGIEATTRATVPAALATWSMLAIAVAAATLWVRSRDPELPTPYAAAAAVVVLWTAVYLSLLILGPLGLYRPLVLRALVVITIAATAAIGWRRRPTTVARGAPPGRAVVPGWWLALLAILLAIGPLTLMELGSPVSPFMDVLPLVAGVQKIVTFQYYDPFKNDASGLIALGRNAIGYDAPLSFVSLVIGAPAYLGVTSLIVPAALLLVFATYLLGRTVAGGLAGGFATLFLLQTFVWRRTPDIRGTALAFSLVAIGLAFFFGTRRVRPRIGLGGLALGLAVTVNPLIGAVGMQTASVATVVAALDLGRSFMAPVAALAAGSLLASPQVLIGLSSRVPLSALAVSAIIGLGCCIVVIRSPRARIRDQWASPYARLAAIVALPMVALAVHGYQQNEFVNDKWFGYGMLTLFALGGLAVAAERAWRDPAHGFGAALPALAIWVAFVNFTVADPRRFVPDIEMRSLASEVVPKMVSYCAPYWLCLASGMWFARVARATGVVPTIVVALLLVIYPVRLADPALDYSGDEMSVAETWGFHLTHAARGYWAGYADRRWVLDDDWRRLADVLRDEKRAGRVTYDTHLLHIAPGLNSVEVALATGVSVDLVTSQYNAQSIWLVGTRARGPESLAAAFAERPPYVLVDQANPALYPQLRDYDEILKVPRFHLYRRKGYAGPGSAP